jgi:hypothetical protein
MRQIIYSKEFDLAVEKIGGYGLVDIAIETILDGLVHNPYGFMKFENDVISFRWAVIRGVPNCPPLYVTFNILGTKDVELTHVEVLDP